jgi:hypothetical protein
MQWCALSLVLVVAGCSAADVTPGVLVSGEPEVYVQQVEGGYPEGFLEEVTVVAGNLLTSYVETSDRITSRQQDAHTLRPLVTAQWWEQEQEGFRYFETHNLRTLGTSTLSRILVSSARTTPEGLIEVGAIACVDSTSVFVFSAELPDPPAELWDWHPHYEEFAGDEQARADIESFLSHPTVSSGSHEAVMWWLEGDTIEELRIDSSEPWWGVYSCSSEK